MNVTVGNKAQLDKQFSRSCHLRNLKCLQDSWHCCWQIHRGLCTCVKKKIILKRIPQTSHCQRSLLFKKVKIHPAIINKIETRFNWAIICPCVWVCDKLLQPSLTLWDPMDCSSPGSSVHGILQPRILEQVAIPSSRRSSWPRNQTCVSCPLSLLHRQVGSLPLGPPRKPNMSTFPWNSRT